MNTRYIKTSKYNYLFVNPIIKETISENELLFSVTPKQGTSVANHQAPN